MTKTPFGKMPDGTEVEIYTLGDGPFKARVMPFGAHLVSIETPDRDGRIADVTLGYDSFPPYLMTPHRFFGPVVGRFANRIARGTFSLGGKQYHLPLNENGVTSLHGGFKGFNTHLWHAKEIADGVEFTFTSPDGDQGYPGTLKATVRYTVKNSTLALEYLATTDQDTIVNLTNHVYFNLAGEGSGDILQQVMTIYADSFTPLDSREIPLGNLAPVQGTPLDFTKSTPIGARIHDDYDQLRFGLGYDVSYVLRGKAGEMKTAARAVDPKSGRVLTVKTTEPGMQFYTAQHLTPTDRGRHGHVYDKFSGFCLETQHFPDSPNHPNFPSTVLKPGETFRSTTLFEFSTE